MSRFHDGQLVVVLKDLNAKIACRSIVGSIGKVLQRRDHSELEGVKECYYVELDALICYMYASSLQAVPPFQFRFDKVKEAEAE